jgi:hypothetical protein
MKNSKMLIIVTVLLTLSWLKLSLFAQDNLKVLTLSDRVGSEITREERDLFNLFQEYNDFYSAIIYEKDEKLCEVIISRKENETVSDTVVTISKRYFFRLQDFVNNYESFKAGEYTFSNLSDGSQMANKFSAKHFDGNGVSIIELKSGDQIEGELISVRNNTLVLLKDNYNFDEEYYGEYKENLMVIENQKIETIIMEGSSYTFPGILLGALSGFGLGYLVANSGNKETKKDFGEAMGDAIGGAITILGIAILGGIIGGIIGGGTSESDIQFNPESQRDLLYLKELAYYSKEEPEFLKSKN